jgi:hypothetical protein
MVLAAANTYLGLFAGMTIASAIPAAVISMAVLRVLGGGGILENNIVQTGASAGSSIASGVIFTIPALVILGHWTEFEYLWVLAIAGLGGILGVFFSVPLRRALIVDQGLAFPEGKAAAEVLKTGANPAQGVRILAQSALAGGLAKLAAASGLRLFPDTAAGATWVGKSIAYFGTNLSPALLGVGYIVGLNIGVLVLLGGMLSWNIRDPDLQRLLSRRRSRPGRRNRALERRGCRQCDLGHADPLPRRRRDARRRRLGTDLDPQVAAVGHQERAGGGASRHGCRSRAHRARPADAGDPGRHRALHRAAVSAVPVDRRQPRP